MNNKRPSRQRVLSIVLLLLGQPHIYTKKQLMHRYDITSSTFDEDIDYIRNEGLQVDIKKPAYTYAILPDGHFKELKYLLPLTDDEQHKVLCLIDQNTGSPKEAEALKRKIKTLYDFQRLGIRALRKPELEKLDILELAKKNKKRVILEGYRSNSNTTRDRIVEPFFIDTKDGMLQAYDVEEQDSKHFKLNRINRVEVTQDEWAFERKHQRKFTDVFRIADNKTIDVHLQLDTYAYNAMIDSYPNAKNEIYEYNETGKFDFQSRVNVQFLGLTNFILSTRGHVTILHPDELKVHIKAEAQKIIDHLE